MSASEQDRIASFILMIVASADPFRDELIAAYGCEGHGAFKLVRARIAEAAVAVAVWRDAMAPYDIGLRIIKGESLIRNSLVSGRPIVARTIGIPCIEAAQAQAIFDEVGERHRRHLH